MRFTQPRYRIGLLIIIVSLAAELLGCRANQTPISDSSLQPTMKAIKAPTFIYSATTTYTPLATETLTPLPTLEPIQAKETLRQLLMKQESCQSPCFWGVTPNQTTLGEAQNIFNRLDLKLHHTLQNEEKDFYATDFGFGNGLSVSIVLRVQGGFVDSSRTDIGFANYEQFPPIREWLAFSPETIVAQYGVPTYVEFHIGIPPCDDSPCKIFHIMILYFDKSDLVVEYNSKLIKDEKIINVCPLTDDYEGVGVWLGKNADHMPTKRGVSLEESTSLTTEQFYNLLLQKPQIACFDLSRDAIMRKP